MNASGHPLERLVDLVDGLLAPADAAALRAHVESCPVCRVEVARLERARSALVALRHDPELPQDVAASVSALLDREDRVGVRSRTYGWLPWAAGFALIAGLWWAWPTRPDPPGRGPGAGSGLDVVTAARVNHDQIANAGLPPSALLTTDPAALERHFAGRAAPSLRVRVIDLAMMGWQPEGGVLTQLAGRPVALYTYRRPNGDRLICQMFEGTTSELPPTADVRRHRDFDFHVYEDGGVTLVFWQEGRIVCVLASRLPAADVVQLAFEKAMRAG